MEAGSGPGAFVTRARTATLALGLAAIGAWALHASYYVETGKPENLLWACLVALPLAGIGLLARAGWLVGPSALVLTIGIPLWVIDMASGSPPVRGSFATHVAGPLIALAGARAVGLPRGSGVAATLGLLGLLAAARLVGTPSENVNLAFAVHPSTSPYIGSHPLYIAFLTVTLGGSYVALEAVLRRLGWPRPQDLRERSL